MSNPIKKFHSPKGELEWVTIDGEGKENLSGKLQYVANVVIDEDSPIIAEIEKFWEENKPAGFKKDPKSLGIYDHTVDSGEKDEEGNKIFTPDGKKYLAFKTSTTYVDGKAKVIQLYNAQARKVRLPEGVKIGNGTIGQISGAMGIYVNTAKGTKRIIDAGVTLYLDAIKISKLVEFTTDAGFDADEDEGGWTGDEGWTGEETEQSQADETNPKAKPRI